MSGINMPKIGPGECVLPGVTALAGGAAQGAPALTTCNCRWSGGTLVQQCALHEAWRAEALEEAIKAAEDVDEPAWYGYECPNTFQDGQRECVAAIRALAAPQAVARPTDDALWDQTLRERDNYHEWADKLAAAIAEHFGVDIGEHSSANNPWREALDAFPAAPPAVAPAERTGGMSAPTVKTPLPSKYTDDPYYISPEEESAMEREARVADALDAARYRWLRNEAYTSDFDILVMVAGRGHDGEELDEVLDVAIEDTCASDRNPEGGDGEAAPGRSPESAVRQDAPKNEAARASAGPDADGVKLWCETCEGTGKVHQEHQAGCWVGGDYPCPDCDGNGFIVSRRAALSTSQASSAPDVERAIGALVSAAFADGSAQRTGYSASLLSAIDALHNAINSTIPASAAAPAPTEPAKPTHEQAMAGYEVSCRFGVYESRAFDLAYAMFAAFQSATENKPEATCGSGPDEKRNAA